MMAVGILFVLVHPSEINAWLKGGKSMRGFTTRAYGIGGQNSFQIV